VIIKYHYLYQFYYVKVFSTNHHRNLILLDDPGRVNQIISVVCQIQRLDFDCNLVVTRKLIIRIPPGFRFLKILYFKNIEVRALAENVLSMRILNIEYSSK
jgi:hypothetical protein